GGHFLLNKSARTGHVDLVTLRINAHNRQDATAQCCPDEIRWRETPPQTLIVFRRIGDDLPAGRPMSQRAAQLALVFRSHFHHEYELLLTTLLSVTLAHFISGRIKL